MFGFVTKFKTEVYAGFEAVKERLITLEAKVEALFEHAKTADTDKAGVDAVKAESATADTTATAAKTTE